MGESPISNLTPSRSLVVDVAKETAKRVAIGLASALLIKTIGSNVGILESTPQIVDAAENMRGTFGLLGDTADGIVFKAHDYISGNND